MDGENKIQCPNCKVAIRKGDNFCAKCGTKINTTAAAKKSSGSLPNNMIYLFGGLFVLLIILIIYLNQKQEKAPDKSGEPNKTAQSGGMPMDEMPMAVRSKINELKSVVENNPKDLNSLSTWANMMHDAGTLDEAVLYYKKYLVQKENDADARVDMGICFFEMGDIASAMKEMETALTYSPNHQKAHFNIGIISLNNGDLKKSNEYFKKCYEIDPLSPTGKQAKEILDQHKNLKSSNK